MEADGGAATGTGTGLELAVQMVRTHPASVALGGFFLLLVVASICFLWDGVLRPKSRGSRAGGKGSVLDGSFRVEGTTPRELGGMPVLPPGFAPYKRTRIFTDKDVPKALVSRHDTKQHVWGKIHVLSGTLGYTIFESRFAPAELSFLLERGDQGIIPSQAPHKVSVDHGPVKFLVEFWRDPHRHALMERARQAGAADAGTGTAAATASGTRRRRTRGDADTGVPLAAGDFEASQ